MSQTLNLVTLVLLIVGGLNWGLVAFADTNLVSAIFGSGSTLSQLVYGLVAASGIYQIFNLVR